MYRSQGEAAGWRVKRAVVTAAAKWANLKRGVAGAAAGCMPMERDAAPAAADVPLPFLPPYSASTSLVVLPRLSSAPFSRSRQWSPFQRVTQNQHRKLSQMRVPSHTAHLKETRGKAGGRRQSAWDSGGDGSNRCRQGAGTTKFPMRTERAHHADSERRCDGVREAELA